MELAVLSLHDRMVGGIEEAARTGNMQALESYVLKHRLHPQVPYLMADARLERLIPGVRAAYREYEISERLRLYHELVEQPAPRIVGSALVARAFRYASFEAECAGVSAASNYCYVGSGPLPEAALAVRGWARDAAVTCIDADYDIGTVGRRFVSALWPGIRMSFMSAVGYELDYRGFTHIHVSALERSEFLTVKCICETADPGATIMLRSAESLGTLLYEPVSDETRVLLESHGFRRVSTIRGRTVMNTVIYRR